MGTTFYSEGPGARSASDVWEVLSWPSPPPSNVSLSKVSRPST
jgi:hypothetical protein